LCNWPNCGRTAEGLDTAKREKRENEHWDRLLEQIDFHGMVQEEVLGQGGLIKQLAGRILQRALECEMDVHLGYECTQ
jgi:hypothetical protein